MATITERLQLADLFPRNSAGIITARDGLVIADAKRELAERLERFSRAKGADAAIYAEYGFGASKRFNLQEAKAELRSLTSFSEPVRRMLHRPFDRRFVFFHPSVVWSLSRPMADQMVGGDNLALVATRQVTRPQFEHAFVSRDIIEIKACSHDRNTQIFPLFIRESDSELAFTRGTTANLNQTVLANLARDLGVKLKSGTKECGKDEELTPRGVFDYGYAILYCPGYRQRYFEFLRSDFLNANDFFANETGQRRPSLKQNQFGFGIGGPIKEDEVLFFGSYQGTRQVNGIAAGQARTACTASLSTPPLTDDRSPGAQPRWRGLVPGETSARQ